MMEKKTYNVGAVKERLNRYSENEREIFNQTERYERLCSKLYSVGSPILSDMPKAATMMNDKLDDNLARKEELECIIRELVSDQIEEREWIEETISHIRTPDERAVIRMRYIDGERWNEVARMLYGGNVDFQDRKENYVRRALKVHGMALVDMAKHIEGV